MSPEIFVFRDSSLQEKVEQRKVLRVSRAVIWYGNTVLLMRRRGTHFNGQWELPGGKEEPGFDSYATVGKEIQEETGMCGLWDGNTTRQFILIEDAQDRLLHAMVFDATHLSMLGTPYDQMMVVTHISEVTAFTKKVTLDPNSHSEYRWIKPENALTRLSSHLTPYTEFALRAVEAKRAGQTFPKERFDTLPTPVESTSPTPMETMAQIGDLPAVTPR